MQILIFIIGLSLGITLMSILQINKIRFYESNYIPKQKIETRIEELKFSKSRLLNENGETAFIHKLNIRELEKLLN